MTLDGTNTWLLREPGSTDVVVIDPGPDDAEHLDRIVAAASSLDARIVAIVLTHDHPDHIAGVRALSDRVDAPVRARRDNALAIGRQNLAGIEVDVLATPGHTADSVSFQVVADDAVITGDTVLGRGTTVVAYPDGNLAQYLQSLDEIRLLVDRGVVTVLPGHGPVVTDAATAVDAYIAHRHTRLDQIRAARAAGATSVDDILNVVYSDVPDAIRFAAAASVMAQLEYLESQ
jgi:glyoxylase-like metal-dependent hydrolase (beta-lactamase superfamily II)